MDWDKIDGPTGSFYQAKVEEGRRRERAAVTLHHPDLQPLRLYATAACERDGEFKENFEIWGI